MKMILSLCLLALTACGSVDAQPVQEVRTAEVNQSDTVEILPVLGYGADVNRGPCISGYDRVAPGSCRKQNPTGYNPLTTGCNTTGLSSDIPANAKTVTFVLTAKLLTTNAVGLKSMFLQFFNGSDTTCTTIKNQLNFEAYEFTATASTALFTTSFIYEFEVITGKNVNIKVLDNPGGAFSDIQLSILGYTD